MTLAPELVGEREPRTFDELLSLASRQHGVPRREARMLLASASGKRQEWLVAHGPDAAQRAVQTAFLALVQRRAAGEPMAYLTGVREFYGRPFAVTCAVLIPRPDTELLVEVALELSNDMDRPRLLDLGTGSGILAVTLALERHDATVVATDSSAPALAVARGNAAALGTHHIAFFEGDWWQALGGDQDSFDLVVANPPYLAADDPHLVQGDLRHEPRQALVAGPASSEDLLQVIAGAPPRMSPGGWLAVEHGLEQGSLCRHLMQQAGFEAVATRLDMEHRERVTIGRRRR